MKKLNVRRMGSMFFVAMMIFRFPYAAMIGALVGFTALVPIVGSFVGAFVRGACDALLGQLRPKPIRYRLHPVHPVSAKAGLMRPDRIGRDGCLKPYSAGILAEMGLGAVRYQHCPAAIGAVVR